MLHPPDLLAIDVGNSRVKWALVRTHDGAPQIAANGFVPTGSGLDWDVIGAHIEPATVRTVAASVNPAGLTAIQESWHREFSEPAILRNSDLTELETEVEAPERVGIDRLLDAIAARSLCRTGEGAVIVDCGTATTIDAVDPEGRFLGGSILPGRDASLSALTARAAMLSNITLTDVAPEAIGRNTVAALQSGLYWGQRCAILGVAKLVREELIARAHCPVRIFICGGASALLAGAFADEPFADLVEFRIHLTLEGIAHHACRR